MTLLVPLKPADVAERLKARSAVLIDIREPDEFARDHVSGAVHDLVEAVAGTSGAVDATLDLFGPAVHSRDGGGGFLLDGFPRTLSQAKALDDLLTQEQIRINAVLHYTLPFEVLIHRLSGRRTCRKCQAVFHITRPPRVAEICDHCGGGLAQREDDFPEAVEARILAYERSAKPLIDYYVGHGTLRTISADGSPERIYARTLAILDA